LSVLITTTKSPVSTCGVKVGLFFPVKISATVVATRPSGSPAASTMNHSL